MTIRSLLVKIGVDTTGLEAGLKTAQNKIEAHAASLKRIGTAMTTFGGIITGAIGVTVKKTSELGDKIYELSEKTGVSTETLSGYRVAAEMSGISLDSFGRALGMLAKNMVSFDPEAQEANAALVALGISTTDSEGKLKSIDAVMLEVADKFKGIEDGALKSAAAKKIFGKEGQNLIPVLNMGSEGLQQIYDKTKAAGMVFTKEGAEGCSKFQDASILLQESIKGLGAKVATNLMPALAPLIEKITKIVQGVTDWADKHPGLMKVLVPFVTAMGFLGTILGPIVMALPFLAAGFSMLTGPIGLVFFAISGLIGIGILVVSKWGEIKEFLIGVWTTLKETAVTVWNAVAEFFTSLWERIKGVFVGGWEAVKTGFSAFGTAIWDTVQSLVQGIVDKFMWLWNKTKEITTWIKDHTIGIFKKMWEKVSGHSIVPEMVAQVLQKFTTMRTGIGGVMDDVELKTKTGFGNVSDYAQAMATSASDSSGNLAENLKTSGRAILQTLQGKAIGFIIEKVMAALPFPFNLAAVAGAIAAVKTLFGAIKLAEGGIVTGPTLAMIGERGPEAVIPLDRPGALAAAGGVTLRQSNYFYGDISNAGDLDEISRRLAERTLQMISKGRK